MDFITYVGQRLIEAIPGIVGSYEGEVQAHDLSEMEKSIKEMGQAVGKEVMEWWLEAQGESIQRQSSNVNVGDRPTV